jgi:CheY-like chemotaxis protein
MLESNGYRVTQAENGEAALHALATMAELPSLVVLDWWMPIMTGEAFLQAIQVDPKLSSLPVAILSSDPEAAIRFSRPYVPKPFTTDVLLHVLARMMRKRR